MKVLFVGNSFTYYNNMPGLFENMARAVDPDIYVDKLAFGGHFLHQYADFAGEKGKLFLQKLDQADWDIVVIQDQSINPIANYEDFFTAAETLCERIRQKGAKPVLYQTWAYRPDSKKLIDTGLTYEQMYRKLEDAYQTAAAKLHTFAVPVGRAFFEMSKNRPDVNLFQWDDYHPSLEGSLIVASLFLKML